MRPHLPSSQIPAVNVGAYAPCSIDYVVLQELLDPMQPAGSQLPVFMGGQSMGGMLSILTALRDQNAWQVYQ